MKTITEAAHKIERARMILLSFEGKGSSEIARILSTNRPKIDRTLNKVLKFGLESALEDLPPIRSESKDELKQRIGKYFDGLNKAPVRFRWSYKMDEIA